MVGAYKYQDVVLLPLGSLAYILDLAIDVGPEVASGFVIKEENTFSLDTSRNEIILKGHVDHYPGELVRVLEDDIYIESEQLGRWLDMTF